MPVGTLIVRRNARGGIVGYQVVEAGGTVGFNIAQGQVSPTILVNPQAFERQEVDFDKSGGQPIQVRPKGQPFQPPPRPQPPGQHPMGNFRNPYNFVPSLVRNLSDPDLGDGPQVDGDRFHQDRYTGRLDVVMTAKTPLLVPDSEGVEEAANGHKTYRVRLRDELPWIPSSSIRGMLRSAFEIITNSRYGVFPEEHKTPLAFRMDTKDGLQLIPARIEGGRFCLYTGTSAIGSDGSPQAGQPAYAAWLGRYDGGQPAGNALRYADGALPAHGERVGCWIERFRHARWNQQANQHQFDFDYWKVRAIARGDAGAVLPQPTPSANRVMELRRNYHGPVPGTLQWVTGYVCITNANIKGKHDERVFFGNPISKPCGRGHQQQWAALIANYQGQHTKALRRRADAGQGPDEYLGSEPGRTAWSRHVYEQADLQLTEGTLCYVRLSQRDQSVEAVFPVMIARELYPSAPWDLLHESLRPAAKFSQLSPADRVFGWVRQEKENATEGVAKEHAAVNSQVRIGPVRCLSEVTNATQMFETPLSLGILGAPKPEQGRFYVGDVNGFAQARGLSKREAGYVAGKRLRGRKVYPHQPGTLTQDKYWLVANQGRGQEKEYLRPAGPDQQDDQNRSIWGWVKPEAEFGFSIYLQNLSPVELGALLWLLQREPGQYFRFGGGKPFGFGSVVLSIAGHELRTGDALKNHCTDVRGDKALDALPDDLVSKFESAVLRAYPYEEFSRIPFIRAFLISLCGYSDGLPVHYPRNTRQQTAQGEFFKWFVENERRTNQIQDRRESLPDVECDQGLRRY